MNKNIPDFAYAVDGDLEVFYDEDPCQTALDYFNYNGCGTGEVVLIMQGIPYVPTNSDEIEFMGDEWEWLVNDIKPYARYEYNRENDSVKDLGL